MSSSGLPDVGEDYTSSWEHLLSPNEDGRVNFDAITNALDVVDARLNFNSTTFPLRPENTYITAPLLRRIHFLSFSPFMLRRYRARHQNQKELLSESNSRATFLSFAIAWVFAIAACFIALTFLTRDFIRSRSSDVLSLTYKPKAKLRLPVISVCSPLINIPSFPALLSDVPFVPSNTAALSGVAKGIPLWTLRAIDSYPNSAELSWPHAFQRVTAAFRGPDGTTCAARFNKMNISAASESFNMFGYTSRSGSSGQSLKRHDACQFCFQVGRDPKVTLNRTYDGQNNRSEDLSSGLRLHVVVAEPWAACQRYPVEFMMSVDAQVFLTEQVRRNWEELEKRGIIDSAGIDYKNDEEFELYVPSRPPRIETRKIHKEHWKRPFDLGREARSWELICHVYFFSGFFYPAENPQISFRLNKTSYIWERTGKGPYFTKYPISSANLTVARVALAPNRILHLPKMSSKSTQIPVEIYMEDETQEGKDQTTETVEGPGNIGPLRRVSEKAKLVSILDPNTLTRLSLSRTESSVGGKQRIKHRVTLSSAYVGLFAGYAMYRSWFLHVDFSSFLVERIAIQDPMPLIRFIADILGYVSMALGISLYTVIAGPTNVLLFCMVRDDLEAERRRQELIMNEQQVRLEPEDSNVQFSGARNDDGIPTLRRRAA